MPRIYTSVSEPTLAKLQSIQKQENKSFSSVVNKMIELGLEFYDKTSDKNTSEADRKKQELDDKHSEYLLRIMGITSEVLRCVHDKEKSLNKSGSADESLDKIKIKTQSFIDGFLGKSQ